MPTTTSALLLCLLLAPPPAIAANDSRVYEFKAPSELRDFRAEAGAWDVQSGSLHCSTKGAEDRLLWRRSAEGCSALRWQVSSPGRCGVELSHPGDPPLRVWVEREEGRLEVVHDGRTVRSLFFETRGRDPVRVQLRLRPAVSIRVDDDVEVSLELAPPRATELRLRAHESQARFPRLEILREEVDATVEERGLLVDDALELARAGRGRAALDLLAAQLPDLSTDDADWPSELRRGLQRVAVLDPDLRRRSPLRELELRRRRTSRDGTASIALPLTEGWTFESYPCRRVDGPVLVVRHPETEVEISLRRYDQRFEYWFGAEPSVQLVGGGDNEAIAEARLGDVRVEWEGAQVVREAERSEWFGTAGVVWRMDYLRRPGSRLEGPRSHLEFTTRYRGDTLRWAEDGPPAALERMADEIAWMRASWTLQPRTSHR